MLTFGENQFEIEPLQPFGERWRTRQSESPDGKININALTNNEDHVPRLAAEVRRAGLVVMEETCVSPYWRTIPTDPRDVTVSIAHTDPGPYADRVMIQALHAPEGRSAGTSYARHSDLSVAARTEISFLRTVVEAAPKELQDRYRLNALLERYEHPQGGYSFDILDPHQLLGMELARMQQQAYGTLWESGQDLEEIQRVYPAVAAVYNGLLSFYRRVSEASIRYNHVWTPGSTVMVYQDPREAFTDNDRRIFHFRTPRPADLPRDERSLKQDLIFERESRGYGTTYQAYSDLKARDEDEYGF